MKETISKLKIPEIFTKGKEYWTGRSKQEQQRYILLGCAIILTLVVSAVFLGSNKGYEVLYPGINEQEAAQVFAVLKEKGVPAEINSKGEVAVPSGEKNALLLDLAGEFPTTAPNYGVYSNNGGFTATESDRKFYLNAQLQDRLQTTLSAMEGVKSAIVTLNVAEKSNYIWEENRSKSSASVTVTMKPGFKVTTNNASTIKSLVAGSVPTMSLEDVVVIDSATMLEIKAAASGENAGAFNLERLDYEAEYERRLVEKVVGLLSPVYGSGGVNAIATVVIDYDKMLTEELQYVPQDNGNGIKNHVDERYSVGGNAIAGGIVGEENNTDTPIYENNAAGADGEFTDIQRTIDYSISQVKKQIEKGEAILKKATISVIVNDGEFTVEKESQLISVISKGVDIEPANISVTNLTYKDDEDRRVDGEVTFIEQYRTQLIIGMVSLLLLIVLIAFLAMRRSRKKKKVVGTGAVLPNEAEEALRLERIEFEERKNKIKKAATETMSKEAQVANEIREFSNENPEITAALIRAWLKEDE